MKLFYRSLKILVAILLLPVCLGVALALYEIFLKAGTNPDLWKSILAGMGVWILIYIFLPEPKWLYVLGHELTHALWAIGFGGKLKKLHVHADGGHVLITKSNFLTTLAPYFFPLYLIIVVIIFVIGNYFLNWGPYVLWFYFLLGMMYAFHLTLTFSTLKVRQPDIVQEGFIFSAVIILLGNLLILLLGIPLLTKTSLITAFHLSGNKTLEIYSSLYALLRHSFS